MEEVGISTANATVELVEEGLRGAVVGATDAEDDSTANGGDGETDTGAGENEGEEESNPVVQVKVTLPPTATKTTSNTPDGSPTDQQQLTSQLLVPADLGDGLVVAYGGRSLSGVTVAVASAVGNDPDKKDESNKPNVLKFLLPIVACLVLAAGAATAMLTKRRRLLDAVEERPASPPMWAGGGVGITPSPPMYDIGAASAGGVQLIGTHLLDKRGYHEVHYAAMRGDVARLNELICGEGQSLIRTHSYSEAAAPKYETHEANVPGIMMEPSISHALMLRSAIKLEPENHHEVPNSPPHVGMAVDETAFDGGGGGRGGGGNTGSIPVKVVPSSPLVSDSSDSEMIGVTQYSGGGRGGGGGSAAPGAMGATSDYVAPGAANGQFLFQQQRQQPGNRSSMVAAMMSTDSSSGVANASESGGSGKRQQPLEPMYDSATGAGAGASAGTAVDVDADADADAAIRRGSAGVPYSLLELIAHNKSQSTSNPNTSTGTGTSAPEQSLGYLDVRGAEDDDDDDDDTDHPAAANNNHLVTLDMDLFGSSALTLPAAVVEYESASGTESATGSPPPLDCNHVVLNVQDLNGNTPLIWTSRVGHTEAMVTLLQLGTVRVFRQESTLEDVIESHACSFEASMCVTNGIPLGSPLLLPVVTVNCVQTL
jgi:hypothetical protein